MGFRENSVLTETNLTKLNFARSKIKLSIAYIFKKSSEIRFTSQFGFFLLLIYILSKKVEFLGFVTCFFVQKIKI